MTTIKLLLSIAYSQNWFLKQLGIHIAILHGDLNEEVYMKCTLGIHVPNKSLVCKLNKSIYGLNQPSRNQKLTTTTLDLSFLQSKPDYSLFTKKPTNYFTCFLVDVDDLVFAGNCIIEINVIKTILDK